MPETPIYLQTSATALIARGPARYFGVAARYIEHYSITAVDIHRILSDRTESDLLPHNLLNNQLGLINSSWTRNLKALGTII